MFITTDEQLSPKPGPLVISGVRWRRREISFWKGILGIKDPWQQVLAQKMVPGDEIWEFSSPPESWACLAGRAGIALVRDGEVVELITTIMS
jgi:hypothetical protein